VSRVENIEETDAPPFICDFCGGEIEDDQRCPATDDGRRCRQ
jgi:hypothetical protein